MEKAENPLLLHFTAVDAVSSLKSADFRTYQHLLDRKGLGDTVIPFQTDLERACGAQPKGLQPDPFGGGQQRRYLTE